jgi:cytochrome c2
MLWSELRCHDRSSDGVPLFAQSQASKRPASTGMSAARAKDIFDKKCGVCHSANSDVKKFGPGLKAIFKRGLIPIKLLTSLLGCGSRLGMR